MKRNKKYTDFDFSRYLRYKRGEMPGKEMNAFEKEIQKDPFATEAEEGLSAENAGTLEKDISILRQRIRRRARKTSRFIIYRIAASIAVLMIISSVFIVLDRGKTEPGLSSTAGQLEPVKIFRDIPIKENLSTPEVKVEKEGATKSSDNRAAVSSLAKADRATGTDRSSSEKTEQKKPDDVTVSTRERSIVADNKGAEDIVMPPAAEKEPAGEKNDKDLAARTDTQMNVVSEPSVSAVAEMAGYGAKKSEAKRISTGFTPPEPLSGKDEYDRYIKENINRPDSATTGQRVVVLLSFYVLPDGKLDSIRVLKSPGEAFSREAIRLLRSGPAWRPARQDDKPVTDEVRMKIVFE